MHLSKEKRAHLLRILTDAEGYPSLEAMLEATIFDSISPAICPLCECSTEIEPDQTRGWFDHCNTNSVIAAPILAGVI